MVRIVLGRTALVVGTATMLLLASVSPTLGDSPSGDGHPDNTNGPMSDQERASQTAKHGLAQTVENYEQTRIWAPAAPRSQPGYACEFDPCEGGGGSPPTSYTINTMARRQINDDWCGPAAVQVAVNWTRRITIYDQSQSGGDDSSENYRTQTYIGNDIGTTHSAGTSGFQIRNGLNDLGLPPASMPGFTYTYDAAANGSEFHSWIVTDVGLLHTPVVPDLKPHKTGAVYWLPSWSQPVAGAIHWVVIRGYTGFWDGTIGPKVRYSDSSGWNGSTWQVGNWETDALTMWKVTDYLYGKAVN